ncbi:glycosyltransferase family 2 protein [Ruegeria sp.]|uniref:glycosyltransferase family 2 protein n=1 Tax=Ruegeria sp. TaxID=1879320 RepID=UPI003C79F8BF
MTGDQPTWGVVSTVRASARDILRFAAHHLELGATRLYLHLDERNSTAQRPLKDHPQVKLSVCNDAFWQRRNLQRPDTHQRRQSVNATHIYRHTDLDWLTHIDVDEFLWPTASISALLQAVPENVPAIRIRPIEALAAGDDLYKAYIPKGPKRYSLVEKIYPNYGPFLQGGFLSHTQGKLFVRTGMPNISDRIHNVFQNNQLLPCKTELPQIELCHRHAPDWEHWIAHYRFRMAKGSYKPDMAPNVPRERGGLNKNELFSWIEEELGTEGLRAFFDEISAVHPAVMQRLKDHDMIRHRPLNLDRKVAKHFPGSL